MHKPIPHIELQPSFGTIQCILIYLHAWLHYVDEKELKWVVFDLQHSIPTCTSWKSAPWNYAFLMYIQNRQLFCSTPKKDTSISIVLHTNSETTAVLSG